MKKLICTGLFLLYFFAHVYSQNVGIGTASPDSSAKLEINSSDKGFLPPRIALTATDISNPVVNPATGLVVFNTATSGTIPNNVSPGYYYWNGTGWYPVVSKGNVLGDIQYWNGTAWVMVSVGKAGQFLQLQSSNIPAWSGPSFPVLTTTAASAITMNEATGGGNVTDDGGSPLSAVGICYSKTANPSITDSIVTAATGTGIFTSSIVGLLPVTTYYVKAFATNGIGTGYGEEISFTTTAPAVGDTYQGGKVFYILQAGDLGFVPGEVHGLIASTADQSTSAAWGCPLTVVGANGSVIGTGNQNTVTIVTACTTAGIAAELCSSLVSGGYSDWYLPSKDELYKMYVNQGAVGNLAPQKYWCSTEYDSINGWKLNIGNGSWSSNSLKINGYYVRAIRSF